MALVEYEVKDRIGYIILNRPEKLNALNAEMADEIVSSCKRFDLDPEAWVAILSGKGKCFSCGGDMNSPELFDMLDRFFLGILNVKKPLIVAMHHLCLAPTIVMTLCCDIRIAAEGTQIGWPQAKRGFASICGPSILPHVIPRNFSFEYLFTGDFFTAEDALRFGMVNRVVPQEKLMSNAEEIALKIAANAPLAVQGMKEASLAGMEIPFAQRLRVSSMISARTRATKDAQEGQLAFEEKRAPIWKAE